MNRRHIVQYIASTAALLATGTLPYAVSRLLAPNTGPPPVRDYLRPPGALQDDAAFVAACIGCGLCGQVCPPQCILFHQREGGDKVNTPYINPTLSACILCDQCMQVCPTEALTPVDKNDVNMGIAQIDRLACYPWVDRGVCGACVSVCPLGSRAITFNFAGFYQPIIQDGCVGCGQCVEVCPHPSLPIWVVDRAQGKVAKHT